MAHETETKVLNVNKNLISRKMKGLGAKEILRTRYIVRWFWPKGSKEGKTPWYLRIRTTSEGTSEITFKGISKKLGTSRTHREINVHVEDPIKVSELFIALGLEQYAYQEKDRISWIYKHWRFELDRYPDMPEYLEIEGKSEKHINEAIQLLQLKNHKTSNEGERILIQEEYNLNWYTMKFHENK